MCHLDGEGVTKASNQAAKPWVGSVRRVCNGSQMRVQIFFILSLCGVFGCEAAPRTVVEAGRYWAHARGAGAAPRAITAWIEHKAKVETWQSAVPSPRRDVVPGASLDAVDSWISGLAPETEYEARLCIEEGKGSPRCGQSAVILTKPGVLLPWVEVDPSVPRQLRLETGERFVVWGNNFVGVKVAGLSNQLVEDQMYTADGLVAIDADLARLVNSAPPNGVNNAIRMHLQLHTFLLDATTANPEALARYAHVIELAEDRGLRVMVTGLNYFYPADNPPWIAEQTSEADHWATQAVWWNAMAKALRHSPGVFAYDLMNEPYTSGGRLEGGLAWYTTTAPSSYCDYGADSALGIKGTCFGQYITAELGGRPAAEVAAAWTAQLRQAIRFSGAEENDRRHLITIGVGAFGLNNSFNFAAEVNASLDFLSPHLYPEGDGADTTIALAKALAERTPNKPIMVWTI